MDIALLILIVLVFLAILAAFWRGRWQLLFSGFKQAGLTLKSMWLRILIGVTFGGLFQVLLPADLVAEWLGPTSGLKGILIGSYAGIIISGGPYVSLPIIASVYAAGAGVGPIIAFLVSIHLVDIRMLIIWQVPFLGIKVAVVRYIVGLFIPPLVGLAGGALYQLLGVA
jgi:uncharacterized membrane protein YraQ (UPF0718 family)